MIFKYLAIAAICFASPACADASNPTNNPTTKPTFQEWAGVGCPEGWIEGKNYKPKTLVSVDEVVYQCSRDE